MDPTIPTNGGEGRGEILDALLTLSGRLEQAAARGETGTLTEMLLAREHILVRLERGDAGHGPPGADPLQRDVARELQRIDTEVLRHLESLRRGVVARSMQDQVPPPRRRGGSRRKSSGR